MEKAALNIITLLLVNEVLLRTGISEECRFGERSIELIFPEVSSLCRTQERIDVLIASGCSACTEFRFTNGISHLAELSCSCLWEHVGVVAGSRLLRIFDLSVFTVWNFRVEDAGIGLRTKSFLLFCRVRWIINARAWVLSWRELPVFDFNCRLEKFSDLLGSLKITNLGSFLVCMHVGVVKSRSHRVLLRPTGFCSLPSACVHVHIDFL